MDICCIQILSHLENIFQIEAMAWLTNPFYKPRSNLSSEASCRGHTVVRLRMLAKTGKYQNSVLKTFLE